VFGYAKGFTIYDAGDTRALLKRIIKEFEADVLGFSVANVAAKISKLKNELIDADTYARQANMADPQEAVFLEIFRQYTRTLSAANAFDFDDLIAQTVYLFRAFPHVAELYQRRFRHILVDEYQDTNHAQYALIRELTRPVAELPPAALTVVGDSDQSIYAFRGADIRNIVEFEHDFPEAKVVLLEQNYRSTQTILDAANAVIANNFDRKPKNLFTVDGAGAKITGFTGYSGHDEAQFVADEIEQLHRSGMEYRDVAVFYRTNAQTRALEEILIRSAVPYRILGGTKFYERAEIKDAVAYLSLLVNPADLVSFQRIVNSPRRGIGNTTQGRLASHANTTGMPIWEVIERVEEVPGLSGAAIKSVSRFYEIMATLRRRADEEGPVATLLETVLNESGYLEALAAERTVEAEGRAENLEELVGVAAEFDVNRELEGEGEVSPLEEFLQQISLYTEQDGLRDEPAITLMTLHNAKGLEYDTVFVVGCEDGAFPHLRALEEGGEEEERRLCYVGITRAKRRLYMTWTRERRLFGRAERNLPSRFVDELPAELTERHASAPAAGTTWGGGVAETSSGVEPLDPGPALALRTGDDVVHASFGDGVVTAVEPGGVVVVRFSGDGSERKLMADYAPIRKR